MVWRAQARMSSPSRKALKAGLLTLYDRRPEVPLKLLYGLAEGRLTYGKEAGRTAIVLFFGQDDQIAQMFDLKPALH
jgi:hypothetical protein